MKPQDVPQILLVEDDDDHAEIVARGLANSSVESRLHRVSDGEAALNYVFRRGPYADAGLSPGPNLILLDLRLPVVDGIEVLRTIKASPELRDIPVVMLTTSSAPGQAMRVSDHVRAQGAILGKAMTGLKAGRGMVLVLVTLQ